MANYLVAKCGNTTSSYSLRFTEPSKPYLKVSNGYLPLTTDTKTGIQLKVNNKTYNIQESYTTLTSTKKSIYVISVQFINTYFDTTVSYYSSSYKWIPYAEVMLTTYDYTAIVFSTSKNGYFGLRFSLNNGIKTQTISIGYTLTEYNYKSYAHNFGTSELNFNGSFADVYFWEMSGRRPDYITALIYNTKTNYIHETTVNIISNSLFIESIPYQYITESRKNSMRFPIGNTIYCSETIKLKTNVWLTESRYSTYDKSTSRYNKFSTMFNYKWFISSSEIFTSNYTTATLTTYSTTCTTTTQ